MPTSALNSVSRGQPAIWLQRFLRVLRCAARARSHAGNARNLAAIGTAQVCWLEMPTDDSQLVMLLLRYSLCGVQCSFVITLLQCLRVCLASSSANFHVCLHPLHAACTSNTSICIAKSRWCFLLNGDDHWRTYSCSSGGGLMKSLMDRLPRLCCRTLRSKLLQI